MFDVNNIRSFRQLGLGRKHVNAISGCLPRSGDGWSGFLFLSVQIQQGYKQEYIRSWGLTAAELCESNSKHPTLAGVFTAWSFEVFHRLTRS